MIMFEDLNPPKAITKPQDSPDWNAPKVGLGDRVERIAQPVARVIDRLAGTNIQGCGGCKKRREALNKAFPLN
jgi:hypothetical protein|tara:strand:- start:2579 stop:2797 length:219 start_codon:yes stop_codon:yes gene_type:complete